VRHALAETVELEPAHATVSSTARGRARARPDRRRSVQPVHCLRHRVDVADCLYDHLSCDRALRCPLRLRMLAVVRRPELWALCGAPASGVIAVRTRRRTEASSSRSAGFHVCSEKRPYSKFPPEVLVCLEHQDVHAPLREE